MTHADRKEIQNPPWAYDESGQSFEFVSVETASRVLDAFDDSIETLLDLSCEAYDDLIDWACYAHEYFQGKHELNADLDKWKSRIHEYARLIHEEKQ